MSTPETIVLRFVQSHTAPNNRTKGDQNTSAMMNKQQSSKRVPRRPNSLLFTSQRNEIEEEETDYDLDEERTFISGDLFLCLLSSYNCESEVVCSRYQSSFRTKTVDLAGSDIKSIVHETQHESYRMKQLTMYTEFYLMPTIATQDSLFSCEGPLVGFTCSQLECLFILDESSPRKGKYHYHRPLYQQSLRSTS